MKMQCETQVKSKKWVSQVELINDACQLNVIHQFLIKKLELQSESLKS